MIPSFYAQPVRLGDHDKSYAVRVWRLEDWLHPELNVQSLDSIRPSVEFPCQDREDSELLVDRLNALQAILAGGCCGRISV